ncbi:MAG: hypothetical protein IKU98_02595 [Bacteroidaceae bacterium]|nr:hypothetical protein [Bacteroidaceae bacterium]
MSYASQGSKFNHRRGRVCLLFYKIQNSTAIVIVIVIVKAIAIANSQSSRFNGRGGLRHPELVSGSDN